MKKTKPKSKKSKLKPQKKIGLKLDQMIWPMERDVLYRPDRLKYVRRLVEPQGCVFCMAADGEIHFESLCLYKTKRSMIVLNKFPYNSGHLLVLPRAHIGKLTELGELDFVDLHQTLKIGLQAIEKIYAPAGINLGMNQGAVAGAGIPQHVHYHLIPRWAGDLNFFPIIAETKVVVETLEQTYARFIEYFKDIRND